MAVGGPDDGDLHPIGLLQLREREVIEIWRRRQSIGRTRRNVRSGPHQTPTAAEQQTVATSLVGLSLSGGGVRSSMFNTGVLQGLHENGLLDHTDYMVTVSGGGFIGGFLTSQWHRRHKALPDAPVAGERGLFALKRDADGQNANVLQLMRSGGYLNDPLALGLRVVSGILWHLILVMALLISSCSLLAFAWRIPDSSTAQTTMAWLVDLIDPNPGREVSPWMLFVEGGVAGLLAFMIAISYGLIPRVAVAFTLLRSRRSSGTPETLGRYALGLFADAAASLASLRSGQSSERPRTPWRFACILAPIVAATVVYEGGLRLAAANWFASSDVLRNLVPLGVLAWLVGMIGRAQREYLVASRSPGDRYDTSYYEWPGPWPLLRLIADNRGAIMAFGTVLTLLILLGNGDTDLGPRLGRLVRQFLPESFSFSTSLQPYSIKIRNNLTLDAWLRSITQYAFFAQVLIGIVPVLMPSQFASSGGGQANNLSRGVYRTVIFTMFVSLPLVICYMFGQENISGALQDQDGVPVPIKRMAVCRDPISGKYRYLVDLDQWARLRWFAAGLAVLLVTNWRLDLNKTSLHRFYRRQLKRAYFDAFRDGKFSADESDFLEETRLEEIKCGETGAPYHIVSTTMNELTLGSRALDSGCNFILSPLYCGWSRCAPTEGLPITDRAPEGRPADGGGAPLLWGSLPSEHESCYVKTAEYKGLRLVDAIAISGGAISPFRSSSVFDALLLLIANARLGQWMANPGLLLSPRSADPARERQPPSDPKKQEFRDLLADRGHGIPRAPAFDLLHGIFSRPFNRRSRCFLSDGAHYDNLGLELLFERRCRLIIASDASYDPSYKFADLVKALRRLRSSWGIEFFLRSDDPRIGSSPRPEFLPASLLDFNHFACREASATGKKSETIRRTRAHHLTIPFRYPEESSGFQGDERWGLLVVLKPSITGDEDGRSPGLLAYADGDSAFPMDDDNNQFFDENQCDYYRELGNQVARSILLKPAPNKDDVGPLPAWRTLDTRDTLDAIFRKISKPRQPGVSTKT